MMFNKMRIEKLFNRLRDKGLFWSYAKTICFEECGEKLLIEHLLKYADFNDIKEALELFGKNLLKQVWVERSKGDQRFIKTNLMIARVFFCMDVESNYFKESQNGRFEKLKLLTS